MNKIFTINDKTKCIYQKLDNINSVTITVLFGVGSINEDKNLNGISHLIEHLFFQGNKKFKTNYEIGNYINNYGGYINASTYYSFTYYYISINKKNLEEALYLLHNVLYNSTFTNIDLQKKIVLNEIKKILNNPNKNIFQILYSLVFSGTIYENKIGGNTKTIKNINKNDLEKYINNYYKNDNMLISIAGNVGFRTTKNLLQKYFKNNIMFDKNNTMFDKNENNSDSNSNSNNSNSNNSNSNSNNSNSSSNGNINSNNDINYDYFVNNQLKYRYTNYIQKNTSLCYIGICFPIMGKTDKRYYSCLILHCLLGANMSSRLYNTVRQQYGYTYTIKTYIEPMKDLSLFVIYYTTKYNCISKSIRCVIDELNKVKKYKISKKELDRCKNYLIGIDKIDCISSFNTSVENACNLFNYNKYLSKQQYYNNINDVSINDVINIANEIFNMNRLNIALISPKKFYIK